MSSCSLSMTSFIAVILMTCFCSSSNGARLLFVVSSINSHVMQFSRLGLELARLGHDVRVVTPSSSRVPDFVRQYHHGHTTGESSDVTIANGGRFNFTTFAVDDKVSYVNSPEYSGLIMQAALSPSSLERARLTFSTFMKLLDQFERESDKLIEKSNMDDFRQGQFEFVIVDPIAKYLSVPLSLGVPYAYMSVLITPTSFHMPRLPSFAPVHMLDFSDCMTFTQRLVNFLVNLFAELAFSLSLRMLPVPAGPSTAEYFIDLKQAVEQSTLLLLVEDPMIGFALPQMPNTVAIGDAMSGQPVLPLPPDLESFVAASTDGVVVASFGSYVDRLPDDLIQKFCDAFRGLGKGKRVIWKLKNSDLCSDVEHVKTVSWLPQNDLLGDKRVNLFITHGGMNSVMEAAYHAKPMIAFPLFADQPINAQAAVSKGYAIRMDIRDFTAETLLKNIDEIFSDPKYQKNAQRMSSILRDRKDTPAERVSYMVNHVIKYGDSHLRSGAFELNTVQFLMLDIYTFIYTVILIISILSYLSIRYVCCKFCFNRKGTVEHKKFKQN